MKKISDVTPFCLSTIQAKRQDPSKMYLALWLRISFAVGREDHIRKIGINAFVVYIVLKTHVNKSGTCFLSLKSIRYVCGLSINTIRKAIDVLEYNGWAKKIGQIKSKRGKFATNKYQLIEKNLIRGSSEPGFIERPLSKNDNGDSNLTHIN